MSLGGVIQAVLTRWPRGDVYGRDGLLCSIGRGVRYDRGGARWLNLWSLAMLEVDDGGHTTYLGRWLCYSELPSSSSDCSFSLL